MVRLSDIPLLVRLPLLAAALMVLVGIFASQQVLTALTRFQEQKLRELAQVHLDGLSIALTPAVLRQDVWEIYDTLDRAAVVGQGMRATMTVVADASGRVLAASDPLRVPTGAAMSDFAGAAQSVDELSLDNAGNQLRVLVPLLSQGQTIGSIAAELDVTDLAEERRQTAVTLLMANAAATLALAAGGMLLMWRMLRPISTLTQHMGQGSGATDMIPEAEIPKGDTEIARLFHTFNAMVTEVRARGEAERRLAARERFVSLGRLSSSLAHEINNPLGGLLNAVDTVRTYADRPDVVRESADLLDRGLRHLRDVARATLDFNRTDMSDTPLSSKDFDDLKLLVSPEVARFGQTLIWQTGAADADLAALPAAPVRQVALNLLLNAAAAAGHGGRVGLATEVTGPHLRLTISDSGQGLSPDAYARIFGDGPGEPGGGVGLRLVRDLTRGLGGRISHERRLSETVLSVVLPILREQSA